MNAKTPIKVIKRDERNRHEQAAEETAKKPAQETARDMVATVTSWVNEFQQKRRMETTKAIKNLFTDTAPQPSKA